MWHVAYRGGDLHAGSRRRGWRVSSMNTTRGLTSIVAANLRPSRQTGSRCAQRRQCLGAPHRPRRHVARLRALTAPPRSAVCQQLRDGRHQMADVDARFRRGVFCGHLVGVGRHPLRIAQCGARGGGVPGPRRTHFPSQVACDVRPRSNIRPAHSKCGATRVPLIRVGLRRHPEGVRDPGPGSIQELL